MKKMPSPPKMMNDLLFNPRKPYPGGRDPGF